MRFVEDRGDCGVERGHFGAWLGDSGTQDRLVVGLDNGIEYSRRMA